MKKISGIVLVFVSFILTAQISDEYDRVLSERNNLYNFLHNAESSDTLSPVKKLELWQNLIQLDNRMLDEWIPALHMQADSLKTVMLLSETKFHDEKTELLFENKMLFYGGIALAGLLLFFLIILIVQVFKKRRLKKKVLVLMQAERERDAYKSALDDKICEMKIVKNENQGFEEIVARLKRELAEKTEGLNSQIESLKLQLQNSETELKNKETSLEFVRQSLETEISKLQLEIEQNTLVAKAESQDDFKLQIEELTLQMEKEREESVQKQLEKDLLAEDMRKELHSLKTLLDEKERDQHQQRFSEVSDVIEENVRLRRIIDELNGAVEEYRMLLEKELEYKKEIELMLREYMKK